MENPEYVSLPVVCSKRDDSEIEEKWAIMPPLKLARKILQVRLAHGCLLALFKSL